MSATELDTPSGDIAPEFIENANKGLLTSSLLVVAGRSFVLGFTVYNSNAATRFCLMFDAATLPGNASVPLAVWQIPTQSTLAISYPRPGRLFRRGCWLVNSTTDTTLTIGAADQLMDAQWWSLDA